MLAEIPPINLQFELATAVSMGVAIGTGIGGGLTFVARITLALWTRESAAKDAMMERYIGLLTKTVEALALSAAIHAKVDPSGNAT